MATVNELVSQALQEYLKQVKESGYYERDLESFGYFLKDYIIKGGEITVADKQLSLTEMIACLDQTLYRIHPKSFTATEPNKTYYIDFTKSNGFLIGEAHPTDPYLPVWKLTTDAAGVISVEDQRGISGGVRFKDDIAGIVIDSIAVAESNIVDDSVSHRKIKGKIEESKLKLDYPSSTLNARISNIVSNAGNSNTEIVDARLSGSIAYPTLKDRLDDEIGSLFDSVSGNTTQLADTVIKATENSRASNYYWLPETQPPARADIPGYFLDGWNKRADQYITDHFEPLRLDNEEYITRDNMGKDASGTYDVWRYFFTPKNYSKTIYITSCMHGGEVTTMIAMLRFLHYLVNEYEKYPQLSYIRENVRIIYIPFVNPWGVSQVAARKRQNANGVDLNRNFDYKWAEYKASGTRAPFDHDYEGTAAFSEVETQYVKRTFDEFPSIIAYLDLHNTGTSIHDFYIELPEGVYPHRVLYDQMLDYFSKGIQDPDIFILTTTNPNQCNYFHHTYGIPASNPEFCDGRWGTKTFDSAELTQAVKWFANIIIEHCRQFEPEDFVIEGYYNKGASSITLPLTNYAELVNSRIAVKIPGDGLLKVTIGASVYCTDATSIVYLAPLIEQSGIEWTTAMANNEAITQGSRTTVTLFANKRVKASEGAFGIAYVKLFGKHAVGIAEITRLRLRIEFIPAKTNKRYTVLSATGREALGENAFTRVYPPTKI